MPESFVHAEIIDQPECWRRAAETDTANALPRPGESVAAVGCGTSWFIAQAYASLRESAGHGTTDAFAASEVPTGRHYDRVVAITRSGTTTEVLQLLAELPANTTSTVLTAVPEKVGNRAAHIVDLSFCDERSVVQTRFATTVLAVLRAHLGADLRPVIEQAQQALEQSLPQELLRAEQITFLGTGWTTGLAHEAALKLREAAQAWTESYPALDYRHGPISIAQPGRAVWCLGAPPHGLADDVRKTGAHFEHTGRDPHADLVAAQLLAVQRAEAAGLDPDSPRHLTRSVVLTDG